MSLREIAAAQVSAEEYLPDIDSDLREQYSDTARGMGLSTAPGGIDVLVANGCGPTLARHCGHAAATLVLVPAAARACSPATPCGSPSRSPG